jgi:hypothetical protein
MFRASQASAIDEECATVRKRCEDRVTLPHIEHAYFEFPRRQIRMEGMSGDEKREGQQHRRRNPFRRRNRRGKLPAGCAFGALRCGRAGRNGHRDENDEEEDGEPERRARDAVGSAGNRTEPFRDAQEQTGKIAQHFCEKEREFAPHEGEAQSNKAQGNDEPGQDYRRDVAERPHQAHAMKIAREQWHHAPLDHQRKKDDFPEPQGEAHRRYDDRFQVARHGMRRTCHELVHGGAHLDAELPDFRREHAVAGYIGQMLQPGSVRHAGPLEPWQGERGDHRRSQERQLKTGIGERKGILEKNAERSERDHVEEIDAPKQGTRTQE